MKHLNEKKKWHELMAQQESEHKLLTLDTVMYQRTYFV